MVNSLLIGVLVTALLGSGVVGTVLVNGGMIGMMGDREGCGMARGTNGCSMMDNANHEDCAENMDTHCNNINGTGAEACPEPQEDCQLMDDEYCDMMVNRSSAV